MSLTKTSTSKTELSTIASFPSQLRREVYEITIRLQKTVGSSHNRAYVYHNSIRRYSIAEQLLISLVINSLGTLLFCNNNSSLVVLSYHQQYLLHHRLITHLATSSSHTFSQLIYPPSDLSLVVEFIITTTVINHDQHFIDLINTAQLPNIVTLPSPLPPTLQITRAPVLVPPQFGEFTNNTDPTDSDKGHNKSKQ